MLATPILSAPLSAPAPWAEDDDDRELRSRLVAALERHQGNISAVAREMSKARNQIRRWCKKFIIDPATFRR